MKALRVFANIIIGIILFALVFSLIFIRETNKIISSNVLKESVHNIVSDISDNDMELTDSQKDALDDMFKDAETKDIISLILKNYKAYRNDEFYYISNEDAKTFYDYIYKNKNNIVDSAIGRMTDEEFKEYYNNAKINDMAKHLFKELDKVFDSKVLDKILDGYTLATSLFARLTILTVIIIFIVILCMINWSLISWMVVFGAALIASGGLFNLLYVGAETVKELLLKDKINISINLNSFLFVGIVQVVLGIILIIIHYFLKTKVKESPIK